MKHLFKVAEIDETSSDVCWSLQEVLDILRDEAGDKPYKDIFLWTKNAIDDRGMSITELHFGEKDEQDIEGVEIDANSV